MKTILLAVISLVITQLLYSQNTVEVKFRNVSAAAIDPAAMNFYITVIR